MDGTLRDRTPESQKRPLYKRGTKKYERVVERVRRALGKYPSVSKFYTVSNIRSEEKPALMADINLEMKVDWEDVESCNGVSFL